ncbi:DUF4129 domain-containing protein [Jidongwangia harbinensis]|uniref:DUF4129 domain-containing protein n=1 Tax=Jidongwangia harbinensis TaxID=2878561 RepID=UPI001CD930AA|nr:DUF4129 domain-containing protein [Jidongwangia harbinensis]MCA2218455.1 DUF4129 domain-containing protein [Jidongwangia harbinensis]
MTRAWDELAAAVFDVVPPGVLLLLSLLAAGVIAALWYWFPAWVPRRLPRWRLRRRRRKKPAAPVQAAETAPPTSTPARPADETTVVVRDGMSLADRYAAEGRYAEAIRQRLRDAVGDLVAARVVAPQPGWTAAELAAVAATQRPGVAGPLGEATELFSEIWYGDRPAHRDHDEHMRALTAQVRAGAR